MIITIPTWLLRMAAFGAAAGIVCLALIGVWFLWVFRDFRINF